MNRIAKSVVNGGATYASRMVLACTRRKSASALRAASADGRSARSSASCSFCHSSSGNLASTGSQHGCPSSPRPGRRIANSTRWPLPGTVSTLVAYCCGVSTSASSAASWTSPHMPRVFTLARTRFRSPTPVASVCISPRPRCTCSRRSDTILNDSPSRCSSVVCSFSSTVARICSSFAVLSVRSASRRCSTVARTASSRCSLDSVSLVSCSPNPCSCRCCSPAMSVSCCWVASRN